MRNITPIYALQEAQSIINNLTFRRKFVEDREYFAAWFSKTLDLDPQQEGIVRNELGVPKGEFEGLQKRIQIMRTYAQTENKSDEENK